jgi:hypothetical protein
MQKSERRCCSFDHKSADVRPNDQILTGFWSPYLHIRFLQRTLIWPKQGFCTSAFLEEDMKKIALVAAVIAVAATAAAFAGGMEAPVMEEIVVMEEAAGTSAGGMLLSILLLLLVAAAIAAG